MSTLNKMYDIQKKFSNMFLHKVRGEKETDEGTLDLLVEKLFQIGECLISCCSAFVLLFLSLFFVFFY
jgi:hypothetical protein